ncbi:MAG: DUF1345 domain-containing protein [Chitinophagaceae bacterium]|nr:DUF1345 domain-containing protein [Chitinophagaceae bacterium]
MPKSSTSENIFLKIHPLQRALISLIFSIATFFLLRHNNMSPLVFSVILWDVFALTYLIICWIVLFKRSPTQIRNIATKQDGSTFFVFTIILLSSFASMITVLILIVSKEISQNAQGYDLPVTIASILLSWMMVHTTFAFHYAHLYYDDHEADASKHAQGLEFPSEKKPDYLDFAYFAFVVGMTFQVSDVQITSGKLRRVVLFHGLLSFGLNTFVVAFTINIIAGLQKIN